MEGLKIPIGAPLQQLTKDLNGAKSQVKSFVGYTDAELLKSQQRQYGSSRKIIQVNEQLAEAAAAAAKQQRLQAAATAAQGTGLAGLGSGLTKAFTGLRTLAYILPGLGIAGIFNLAFEAIGPLIAQLDIFNRKVDDTGQKYRSLKDAIAQGNQEAGKEVTTLRLLYEAATNVANSTETRNKAAKELIRLYPETFAGASKEAIKNGELSSTYKALTKDIIENARAKSIAAKISDLEAKKLDAEIKLQKIANANANENARAQDRTYDLGRGFSMKVTAEQEISSNNRRAQSAVDATKKIIASLTNEQKFLEQFVGDKNLVNALVGDEKAVGRAKEKIQEIKKEFFATVKAIEVNQLKQLPNKEGNVVGNRIFIKPQLDLVELYSSGDILKEYFQYDLLPQVGNSFTTFFDDILTKGEVSFKSLGESIKRTFASVLASEATTGLLGLLGAKGKDQEKGGLFKTIGGILGGGKGGGGGLLGKIIPGVGIALGIGALVGGIFKKKKTVPTPVSSASLSPSSVNSGGVDIAGGRVVFEISGVNLVGVLNRAGQKLARYGV